MERRSIAVVWSVAMSLLLVLPAAGEDEIRDERVSGAIGHWNGQAIAIDWRPAHRTLFRPETLVLIKNLLESRVAFHMMWKPRLCGGESIPLGGEGRGFIADLYSSDTPIHGGLEASGWDAFLFPHGDLLFAKGAQAGECVTEITVRALVDGREIERVTISVDRVRRED